MGGRNIIIRGDKTSIPIKGNIGECLTKKAIASSAPIMHKPVANRAAIVKFLFLSSIFNFKTAVDSSAGVREFGFEAVATNFAPYSAPDCA